MSLTIKGNLTVDSSNQGSVLVPELGGTGANSLTAALTNLLPSQTGAVGKYLRVVSQGVVDWDVAGSDITIDSGSTGLTFIEDEDLTGTLVVGGRLSIINGGTGANTVEGILNNLNVRSAAHYDITVGNNDQTPDRVLKVGDFGIGGDAVKYVLGEEVVSFGEILDFPVGGTAEVFGTVSQILNAGGPALSDDPDEEYTVHVTTYGTLESRFLIASADTVPPRMFIANAHMSGLDPWEELISSGTVLPITSGGTGTTTIGELQEKLGLVGTGVFGDLTDSPITDIEVVGETSKKAHITATGEEITTATGLTIGADTDVFSIYVELLTSSTSATQTVTFVGASGSRKFYRTVMGGNISDWIEIASVSKVVTASVSATTATTIPGTLNILPGVGKVVSLPASPTVGDVVKIVACEEDMLVTGNDNMIAGDSAQVPLIDVGTVYSFTFVGRNVGWAKG